MRAAVGEKRHPRVTAHVLRFPVRAPHQAPTLTTFIRQHLEARADVRLRTVPDHALAADTALSDAVIDCVVRRRADSVDVMERIVCTLIDELDREVQQ